MKKANVLASLIAGKRRISAMRAAPPASSCANRIQRRAGSRAVCCNPQTDPAEWMDKTVMDVDRARIQEVDVFPASGTPYAVRRDKPSDRGFHLASVPKGRELLNSQSPDGVAVAVVGFTFDDIKPAQGFDFNAATRVITHTFDGLTVTVQVIADGADHWARITAEAAKPTAEKEARAIDARTDGWAYKLPAYKGQQFMTTLDSLLKPLPGKAKTAP